MGNLMKRFKKFGYISVEIVIVAAIALVAGFSALGSVIEDGQKATNDAAQKIDDTLQIAGGGLPEGGITEGDSLNMSSGAIVYYRIGSGEPLVFESPAPYSEFRMVMFDDETLMKYSDYTMKKTDAGGTRVTFSDKFVNKLTEGEFTVKILSKNGTATATLITTYTNVLKLEGLSQGYITDDGQVNASVDTLQYTERIPVETGDTLALWHYSGGPTALHARFVTAYDSEGNVVDIKLDSKHLVTVPSGVAYIVMTINTESADKSMILKNTTNTPTRLIEFNGESAGSVSLAEFINVLDLSNVVQGYLTSDGTLNTGEAGLTRTKRIAVEEGDTFTLWVGQTNTSFRFITAYDADGKVVKAAGSESGTKSYTVPAGVASLVFTVSTGSLAQEMIIKNNDGTPYKYIPYNGNNITMELPVHEFVNLFDVSTVGSGYMSTTGGISASSALCYNTTKIEVEEGDVLYVWNNSAPYKARFITAFDADGKAVSSAGTGSPNATYTVPAGIKSVVFTVYTSAMNNIMVFKNDDTVPNTYVPYISKAPETPVIPDMVNFFDPNAVSSGYMGTNGGVSGASSLCYSEKIYVTPGEVLSFWNGVSPYKPRFVTVFNAEGDALSSLGASSPDYTYTVPANVDSVVVTIYTNVLSNFMVLKDLDENEKPTKYIEYNEDYIPERPEPEVPEINDDFSGREYLHTTMGSMGTSSKISLGKADIITDKHLIFKANVTSFSGIRLGHGYTDYTAAYVEIDGTHIRQYSYASGANMLKEEAHGLTITGDLRVSIDVNKRRVATVTITSNGKSYEFKTSTTWYGSNGEIYAQSLGSTFTNAELAFTADGYSKDIQFYGDSYLSQSSDRWLYYAFNAGGGNNALFDGYGGRTSGGAYNSLLVNLEHSSPDIVVWLLGMNDGSDSGNTPSSAWTTTRDKLIQLSQEKGFELVFATIPSVPTINHEAKNAWIRSSGYRYIDVAAGVGSLDGSGTWYDGMLSNDGIHPSALGAEAIYNQVAQDFPEIKN